jgi:hypothetical protein
MADRAQVRSVEAIDDFRAHLVVYLAKVRPLLDEVAGDLRRTQVWMESDARHQAERELRRRARALEEAQQALLSARLSTFREATAMEQNAVHAARRALGEAEERLHRQRRWIREFGPRTDPLARQVAILDSVLSGDLGGAVAWLGEILRALEAYAELRPGTPGPRPPPRRTRRPRRGARRDRTRRPGRRLRTHPARGRNATAQHCRPGGAAMSLSASRSRLNALTRDLAARWEGTRDSWNDAKRDEFERRFLRPLFAAVDKADTALEQLDELVTQVRKDCE